jgi:hypothetical protein
MDSMIRFRRLSRRIAPCFNAILAADVDEVGAIFLGYLMMAVRTRRWTRTGR